MRSAGPLLVRARRPAVVLETAFLTAGLPEGNRIDAALDMARAARSREVRPAFTGVVQGRPIIGLERSEVELLARDGGKASTRDLPAVMARRGHAGTTVAATVALADRAGLKIVATGAIGGVHPGAGPPDISPDLHELARTSVLLVCSGVKSIADIPATFERLETLGISAIGFGTDRLPAFWTADSGLGLAQVADDEDEVATIWEQKRGLDLPGSLLVCVPPPASVALDREEVEAAVGQATADLEAARISGPEVTPYLLARIAEYTDGRSVQANLGLLTQNTAIAAAVVRALRG